MPDLSELDDDELIIRAVGDVFQALDEGFSGFSDISVSDDQLLAPQILREEPERQVLYSWIFGGINTGEFRGMPPTGNRVQFEGITILRPAGDEFVARWLMDEVSLYQQLGHVVPTPRPVDLRSGSPTS